MLSENEILTSYPWITNDLFKRIIQKDHPQAKIQIHSFSTKAALSLGENYASTMIRATVHSIVDGEKVDKRFIIKATHHKEEVRQMLVELRMFEKEITMFRDIIPKVEQLLLDVGEYCQLAAKCYEINDYPDDPYIIFEDLSFREFKNVDRRNGLDIPHFKHSLSKMAKWHAGTAVLLETTNYKDYPEIQTYESMLGSDLLKEMLLKTMKAAKRLTKEIPKFEHLSEKFEKAASNIWSQTKELIKHNETSGFMTLCHGDLWMNNILYCDDSNGSPIDVLLCDFQCVAPGPAVLDVMYHLYTSSNENLRDRDWDLLVQHYHNELASTLRKLNYPKKIPTLTDIQIDILQKGICCVSLMLMFPGARALENTGEDVTNFIGEGEEIDEMNYTTMANPKCRKTLEFLIDFIDRKGYIDVQN